MKKIKESLSDWWLFKGSDIFIFKWYREIKFFLRRWKRNISYLPLINQTYDYDSHGFFTLGLGFAEMLEKNLKSSTVAVHNQATFKSLRIFIKLLKFIKENDRCGYMLEKDWEKIEQKYGRIVFVDVGGYSTLKREKETDENREEMLAMKKMYREKFNRIYEKRLILLGKIFHKYYVYWWD